MSEDVSKAETQSVDMPKADPPKGADSVHEQTREKGERAREEREKMKQGMTGEQDGSDQRDSLEAPPGD
jgi:hypothetical protein